MNHRLISLMVFLPLLGAVIQAFLPSSANKSGILISRWVALGASLASSLIGIGLVFSMQTASPDLQAGEIIPWIGSYAITYEMGLDGLNALLVLLVSIIFPILITSEWKQRLGLRGMHGLFLVLQSALLGAVCAQDLFLMFFFWMLSVLPFYFLIGIWGGSGRESAAFRSIVSASIGNALLFAALVLVYYSVDPHSFSLRELGGGKLIAKTFNFVGVELPVSPVAFGLVCAGLCLRAPIWPFHGWFTKASEEAPASVFIALSAVSVPISIGLFMRLAYSLFPDTVAQAADGIVIVGGINLVMGGICALYQRDLRLLLAFVCLGSVGLVLIGVGSLNSIGVVGSVFQQLLVGLGLAGFGLFTKVMIDRTGSAVFVNSDGAPGFGGVSSKAPAVALVAGVMVASLLGFPGLGGFVGQALVIIGSYTIHPAVVLLTGCALVLATYYLFTMYRHVFLGRPGPDISSFYDLTLRERAYLIPLVCTLVVFGVYPKPLIELVRPTILILLSTIK